MNILPHKAITNITGTTGIRIIQAILEGERDPNKLALLRDQRIKNNVETISKYLEGDYREEHLFILMQEFELYKIYREKIVECDQQIATCYKRLETKANQKPLTTQRKKSSDKNHPHFDLHGELQRVTGVGLAKIPGLDVLSIQTIISEVGIDPHRWPKEKHFVSWLGLNPSNKITGEKVFSTRTRKVINRASTAFRLGAFSISRSQNALGSFFQRIKIVLALPKS